MLRDYLIQWKDNSSELVSGNTFGEALEQVGYEAVSIHDIVFVTPVADPNYHSELYVPVKDPSNIPYTFLWSNGRRLSSNGKTLGDALDKMGYIETAVKDLVLVVIGNGDSYDWRIKREVKEVTPILQDTDMYLTIYWMDGHSEHVRGSTLGNALATYGYTPGYLFEIAFVIPGIDDTYSWSANHWYKRAPGSF